LIELSNQPKLYLAPMRGLTEATYRNVFFRYFSGIDVAISPFITTVKGPSISARHIKDILPKNNYSSIPLIPQLLSKDPDGFIRMANRLFDLGYENINWNLGCPYPMVAKKMRGSGLLPHADIIDAFLDKVLSAIPNRLSLKTRLGRFNENEILSLIPVFNRYPLSYIIIHPRTGKQMYDGTPNLDYFSECLNLLKHPVVYNGDINCLSDFYNFANKFPSVDGWMIGRGMLKNPFLGEIIQTGKVQENTIEVFKQFHDDLFECYQSTLNGPGHVLGKMKGHWQYMSRRFENDRKLLKKIQRVSKLEHYETIVMEMFRQCREKECLWKNVSSQE